MERMHRDIVAAYIISSDKKLLVGRKRADRGIYLDCWHIPGGGIDTDETREAAVVREVMEETGIDVSNEAISLIDDTGEAETVKKKPGIPDALVHMTFAIYLVRLSRSAAEVVPAENDDLVDLTWIDLAEIDTIKLTPPAYELFDRIGRDWLITQQ